MALLHREGTLAQDGVKFKHTRQLATVSEFCIESFSLQIINISRYLIKIIAKISTSLSFEKAILSLRE